MEPADGDVMSPAQLDLQLEMSGIRKEQYLRQFDKSELEDSLLKNLDGPREPARLALPGTEQAATPVYRTDVQDQWSEAMSEDHNGRKDLEVDMRDVPEMDLGKYNDKIKMLEKLRREALRDLQIMEDELGI